MQSIHDMVFPLKLGPGPKRKISVLSYPGSLSRQTQTRSSSGSKFTLWLCCSPLFLLTLSALLFALSFPCNFIEGNATWERGLPVLIYIFALPLLQACRQLRSLREAIFYGAFYGFISYLLLSLWLLDYDWIAFILIPGIYLYYFSIFFSTYYLLDQYILRHGLSEYLSYLAFCVAWILLEYFKSVGWVAYTYGSLLYSHYLQPAPLYFSHNFILKNIADLLILYPAMAIHSFAQRWYASWGTTAQSQKPMLGQFGLACFSIVAAIAILQLAFRKQITLLSQESGQQMLSADSSRTSSLTSRIQLPIAPDKLNIALLQHNINSWQTEEDTSRQALERLLQLSRLAEQAGAELIVWSETAFVPFFRFNRDIDLEPVDESISHLKKQLANAQTEGERQELTDRLHYLLRTYREQFLTRKLQKYLEQAQAIYLIGTNDYGQPDIFPNEQRWAQYNSLLLIQGGKILATYHKHRLVPFTEEAKWPELLPRINAILKRNGFAQYNAGQGSPIIHVPLQNKLYTELKIFAMICYEDSLPLYWPQQLFAPPDLLQALQEQEFDILLSVSNDSWAPSPIGGLQHFSSAVSRAVEQHRYFLRGSTSGQTAVIGPQGQIIERLEANIPGVLYLRLPLEKQKEKQN